MSVATSLTPGRLLCDGQFRLLTSYGADEPTGMEYWHARDLRMDREVALTILVGDPAEPATVRTVEHVLDQVRRAAALGLPAVARVFDVVGPESLYGYRDGVLGLVIADWTPGNDLLDLLRGTRFSPFTACRVVKQLALSTDQAHHAGLVLGAADPRRLRVTGQGVATVAFPGPPPTSSQRGDVRGLGELLYLLLTGTWPGQDLADLADIRRPRHLPGGQFAAPNEADPTVPRDLSLITMLSLSDSGVGGIRTCGPLLGVLDEVLNANVRTDVFPVVGRQPRPARPARPPNRVRQQAVRRTRTALRAAADTVARADGGHRRLAVITGALTVAAIAIAVWIGGQVVGYFQLTTTQAADGTSTGQSSGPPSAVRKSGSPPTNAAPAATPVAPSGVSEYLVTGNADNPGTLSRVIDGDPNTAWKTDEYRQQFPVFLPGIGVQLHFAQPTRIATVTINSPSAGTTVQIRAGSSAHPPLASTTLLATATLKPGDTAIPLRAGSATPYLLVWITQLGDGGEGYQTAINEITCRPAS
ncbi:MAG TPA: protein kinase family protein [Pseudonocardiaceae bacterium]|jgi:hypothetical protein|nr:protein kinase family protein [Pseudonocardiaceae bacterium]